MADRFSSPTRSVRAIFGSGNYRVLDRIESLPRALPAMVLRLTR